MTAPFDVNWLERELTKTNRTMLIPGFVLTLFWAGGTFVSLQRGWRTEWVAIVILAFLAGLPGIWLLKGGFSSGAGHPLLVALRQDRRRITSVNVEWRGGGGHYDGRVMVQVAGYRQFSLVPPKGREEEMANWLRGLAAP